MAAILTNYIRKWTFARGLQLAVGKFFLGNYFEEGGFFNAALGGIMFVQAVLNIGCFSSKGCSTPTYKNDKSISEDIEYEEVK